MAGRKQAGSPKGEPVYLVIGFFRRPHGLRGEIIMDLHTDFPDRIKPGRKIYLGKKYEAATIGDVRVYGRGLLVQLRGFDTPESVGRFRNQWVNVRMEEVPPLPDGKHYKYELIGLEVMDVDGNTLGKVEEILETGANDVYVVRSDDGREVLLPAIPSVILGLDMKRRLLTVHLLDGLIEKH